MEKKPVVFRPVRGDEWSDPSVIAKKAGDHYEAKVRSAVEGRSHKICLDTPLDADTQKFLRRLHKEAEQLSEAAVGTDTWQQIYQGYKPPNVGAVEAQIDILITSGCDLMRNLGTEASTIYGPATLSVDAVAECSVPFPHYTKI